MIFNKHLIYLILLLCLLQQSFAEEVSILVGVTDYQQIEEKMQLLQQKQSCDQVTNFDVSRLLAEAILVCQALKLGGIEPKFKFKEFTSYPRLLQQVTEGDIELMLDSAWLTHANAEKVYISAPLIKEGEFYKGVYTTEKHSALLSATSMKELKKFTAVSNQEWQKDWLALELMQVKKHTVPRYSFMVKMVNANRVDFTLADFSSLEDLSINNYGVRLIPVPNIKIALKGSRHILVNKSKANGLKIYQALQAGLKVLRSNGTIAKAYQESGFHNPIVKNWSVACCEYD